MQNERGVELRVKCENLKGIDHLKDLLVDGKTVQQTETFRTIPRAVKPRCSTLGPYGNTLGYGNQTRETFVNELLKNTKTFVFTFVGIMLLFLVES